MRLTRENQQLLPITSQPGSLDIRLDLLLSTIS